MALTPTRLYLGQPGTGATTLYTVGAGAYVILKEIIISNTSGSPVTFTIGINGVTAAASCFGYLTSIPANTVMDLGQLSAVLNAADTLQALQSTAGACTITASGIVGP